MDHHNHSGTGTFASKSNAFKIGVGLNVVFIIIEAIAGFSASSLALLADAGHNLSDVLGLLISWLALWLSQKQPTKNRTYGYKSSSILAALANAVILLIAIGGIAVEAIQRFADPQPVAGWTVIIVAAVGVVINGLTAWLFVKDQKDDLNIRGAFLHMSADAGVSVGVVITGFISLATSWQWLDPAASLLIAIVILIGTWDLLRKSVNLALNAVPAGLDVDKIKKIILADPSVQSVHDLHVWGMSTTEVAMTVHVVRTTLAYNNEFIAEMNHNLNEDFHICHLTIQTELGKCSPELTDDSV
ncbi:cation diffusion facilitator family transporter [Lapidilactobacillus mulanensis]|uniref:Cation diffusion facilitator family transporter n=1 Tax=Lapidilactobacillus mulanensis TaxID=2485999 RepID=A0ABW4DQ19_9LACO|nr:cation diffusion facilitator family transporter [Lapidilactobacillus mulanensis]